MPEGVTHSIRFRCRLCFHDWFESLPFGSFIRALLVGGNTFNDVTIAGAEPLGLLDRKIICPNCGHDSQLSWDMGRFTFLLPGD